jgi:16S rRNA (uracil1498-N3)-methyltransferase
MRLHRFYIYEPIGSRKVLTVNSPELVNQLRYVLRLKVGEEAILFDGLGSDYKVVIRQFIGTDQTVFDVHESMCSRFMPMRKTYLFAAVIKKDNFEFIVEKATELGVTDIIPIIAEHSEKKALNEERLIRISIEASEQSGRGDIPEIRPIISLKEAVNALKGNFSREESAGGTVVPISEHFSKLKRLQKGGITAGQILKSNDIKCLVFHTDGEPFNQKDLPNDEPIAIFIGPEGGWSPEEIAMFHKNEIIVRCLGPQVLRAETAVIAALSKVLL